MNRCMSYISNNMIIDHAAISITQFINCEDHSGLIRRLDKHASKKGKNREIVRTIDGKKVLINFYLSCEGKLMFRFTTHFNGNLSIREYLCDDKVPSNEGSNNFIPLHIRDRFDLKKVVEEYLFNKILYYCKRILKEVSSSLRSYFEDIGETVFIPKEPYKESFTFHNIEVCVDFPVDKDFSPTENLAFFYNWRLFIKDKLLSVNLLNERPERKRECHAIVKEGEKVFLYESDSVSIHQQELEVSPTTFEQETGLKFGSGRVFLSSEQSVKISQWADSSFKYQDHLKGVLYKGLFLHRAYLKDCSDSLSNQFRIELVIAGKRLKEIIGNRSFTRDFEIAKIFRKLSNYYKQVIPDLMDYKDVPNCSFEEINRVIKQEIMRKKRRSSKQADLEKLCESFIENGYKIKRSSLPRGMQNHVLKDPMFRYVHKHCGVYIINWKYLSQRMGL